MASRESDEARTALGRVLVALGAPRGSKREVVGLAWYLATMPQAVRLDWARTYVCNRGVERPDREGIGLQIKEERNEAYLRQLARLFKTVTTGDAFGVRTSGKHIYFDPSVARQLQQPPAFDGERKEDGS